MSEPLSPEVHERLLAALFAGNKIQAIKIHREATGQGLKESKDTVERWETELRNTVPERFAAPAGFGCAKAASCLVFAAWMVVGYLCGYF